MATLLNTLGYILIQWNNVDQSRNNSVQIVRHLIEISRIIHGSNRYSSDGNQRLEIIIIEVFAVIGGWLMKDQGKYDKLHSVIMSYTSPPVRKQRPYGETTSEPYKPAFHGGHLSCNISHGSAATLWIFCLPWRRYSYSTQSSMMELLLSVSQH